MPRAAPSTAGRAAPNVASQETEDSPATADAADYGIRVERDGQGWQVVNGENGSKVAVHDARAANALRNRFRDDAAQREAQDISRILTGTTTAPATARGDNVASSQASARPFFDGAQLDTLHTRAAQEARRTGAQAIYETVHGADSRRFASRVNSVATSVASRLDAAESASAAFAPVREHTASALRSAISNGALSSADLQSAAAAIAPRLTLTDSSNAHRAFRERLQEVATGRATPAAALDLLSDLAVADVTGRRSDGSEHTAGSVSAAVDTALDQDATGKKLTPFRKFLRAIRHFVRGVIGRIKETFRGRGPGGKLLAELGMGGDTVWTADKVQELLTALRKDTAFPIDYRLQKIIGADLTGDFTDTNLRAIAQQFASLIPTK